MYWDFTGYRSRLEERLASYRTWLEIPYRIRLENSRIRLEKTSQTVGSIHASGWESSPEVVGSGLAPGWKQRRIQLEIFEV